MLWSTCMKNVLHQHPTASTNATAYEQNILERSVEDRHQCHIAASFVDEASLIPALYWLPKLHKRHINHILLLNLVHILLLSWLLPHCT